MTEEKMEELRRILAEIADSSPFKRVVVDKETLQRWNLANGKNLTGAAFTVEKSFEVTEKSVWDLLCGTMGQIDFSKPSKTDCEKTKLI